jgi:hypothetical protein
VKTRQAFAQHLIPGLIIGWALARRTFSAVVAAEAVMRDRRNLDEFVIDSVKETSVDFSEGLVPHLSCLRVKPAPETQRDHQYTGKPPATTIASNGHKSSELLNLRTI